MFISRNSEFISCYSELSHNSKYIAIVYISQLCVYISILSLYLNSEFISRNFEFISQLCLYLAIVFISQF